MLKKRLIGVITVRGGWAVQSFGYQRYLPLGRPEVLAENLDRWGADEILLQCIDRSAGHRGPDLELLDRVSGAGLSTPLIYAGGIATVEQAVAAVKAGADRICVDAMLHDDPGTAAKLCRPLGAQAVIASLPVGSGEDGVDWFDYRGRSAGPLPASLLELLSSGAISEALVIDHRHDGTAGGFDQRLIDGLELGLPIIAFGGLSEPAQLRALLEKEAVAAVAIGNFLNYREHSVQAYRRALPGLPLRPPVFEPALAG